jgi:hypothetical protein
MRRDIVQLTLILPRDLREDLVEILLEHEAIAETGFATRDIDAHGLSLPFRSIGEQIRGRVHQTELTAHLSEKDARDVISILRDTTPTWGISYRISPITETGEIATSPRPDPVHEAPDPGNKEKSG